MDGQNYCFILLTYLLTYAQLFCMCNILAVKWDIAVFFMDPLPADATKRHIKSGYTMSDTSGALFMHVLYVLIFSQRQIPTKGQYDCPCHRLVC